MKKGLLIRIGLGIAILSTIVLSLVLVNNVQKNNFGFSVVSRYKTTLASSMTSNQTTVPVSSITTFDGHVLTMSDLGGFVYLTVEPGTVREEIIKCTTIASSQWATCTRGLAFYGSSETAVSANQHAHNAGATVVMSNVHYVYEQAIDKDSSETASGTKRFASNELIFGDGTTVGTKYLYGCDSVSTSTCGFIYFAVSSTSPGAQDVGWSPDGSTTYSLNLGSAGLVAGKGISITNSIVTFNPAVTSTSGLGFSGLSAVVVNAPGQGLTFYSTGLGVNTTSPFVLSGGITLNTVTTTHNSTSTFTGMYQGGDWGGISPVGSLIAYASTTPPTGWLLANGAAVSRTTYPRLFAVIGTTYGIGDGATTFNLPNLQNRQITMASSTANIGQTYGEANHTQTIAEMPAHTHDVAGFNSGSGGAQSVTEGTNNATAMTAVGAAQSTGGGAAFNVLDPSLVMNYIIRVQ